MNSEETNNKIQEIICLMSDDTPDVARIKELVESISDEISEEIQNKPVRKLEDYELEDIVSTYASMIADKVTHPVDAFNISLNVFNRVANRCIASLDLSLDVFGKINYGQPTDSMVARDEIVADVILNTISCAEDILKNYGTVNVAEIIGKKNKSISVTATEVD